MNNAFTQGYFKYSQEGWQDSLARFYNENRNAVNTAGGGVLGGVLYLLTGGRGVLGGMASAGAGAGLGYLLGQEEPEVKADKTPKPPKTGTSPHYEPPSIVTNPISNLDEDNPINRAADTTWRTLLLQRFFGPQYILKLPAGSDTVIRQRTLRPLKKAILAQQAMGLVHGLHSGANAVKDMDGLSAGQAMALTAFDPIQQGQNIGAILNMSAELGLPFTSGGLSGMLNKQQDVISRQSKALGETLATKMSDMVQQGFSREDILEKYKKAIPMAVLPTGFIEEFNKMTTK